MKLKLCIIGSFFIQIMHAHMHRYYPTKETSNRIVTALYKQSKGAYFSFDAGDIQEALSNKIFSTSLKQTIGLPQPHIVKGLALKCKGLHIYDEYAEKVTSQECYQMINNAQLCGFQGDDIFASDILSMLFITDIHHCIRFMTLLLQASKTLLFADESTCHELAQILPVEIICPLKADVSIEDCKEQLNQQLNGLGGYKILLFCGGAKEKIVASRIFMTQGNLFLFDLGKFLSVYKNNLYKTQRDLFDASMHRIVKIIYTAAIIPQRVVERRNEYMHSLNMLRSFWYDPYIVEACTSSSYFDHISHHVIYSQVNNTRLRNKGVNEINSMRKAISTQHFNDSDMIVKLTGRYYFKDDSFIKFIESTPEYDGYVTLDPRSHFSFSGCFALRFDLFKQMINEINLDQMEKQSLDFERIVLDYMKKVKKNGHKIMFLDEINLYSNVNHQWIFHW